MSDHEVQDMDEIPEDLSFDLSLLDEQLYQSSNTLNGVKKFPDVLDDDMSIIDQSWMNSFISVGNNADNYKNDLAGLALTMTKNPAVNDSISDTESLVGGNSAVPSPSLSEDGQHFAFDVSDDELLKLSVKDLNCQVKGLPKDYVKKIKQRRRTLKNRGYAHSCRLKRLEEKSSLQRTKKELENDLATTKHELQKMAHDLQTMANERNLYKSRYESLLRKVYQQRK